ncbi:MAG TPA: cation-translocating P-type ATPase [Firmicutes bacterium]|nr:cation-translocating P-type ATPase [Bacillota bacterium]
MSDKVSGAHAVEAKAVVAALRSDVQAGLTVEESQKRLQEYGPNKLQEAAKPTLLAKILEQFSDYLVLILVGAAIVSALLGEFLDAAVIVSILILNALIGIIQETKAEEALASLAKMATPNAQVVRGGDYLTIPAEDLVPGDIVFIHAGDKVPADLRLVETQNLRMDESALTGESVPVEKDADAVLSDKAPLAERVNMAYFGTSATYGRGKGIVVATGMETQIGQIAGAIQTIDAEKTPLQKNLAVLGKTLGTVTIAVCAGVLGLGLLRGEPLLEMFLTSVSLAVAAIPEGLPAVVTIVLAIGVKRMADRHVIMRKLSAVETLGCTTVICSDKTGTLTQNQMTVVRAFTGTNYYHVSGRGYEPSGEFVLMPPETEEQVDEVAATLRPEPAGGVKSQGIDDWVLRALLIGGVLNNDAILRKKDSSWEIVGDPTEGALVVAAAKAGFSKDELERRMPRVAEIPFDSKRKTMTTIHKLENGRYVAWVKGAPEIVVGLCSGMLAPRTDHNAIDVAKLEELEVPLDDGARQRLLDANANMASDALRVMAVAYRMLDDLPDKLVPEEIERRLTFVGLLGMIDPPRPEVVPAIQKCKRAGILPIMITGDHNATAFAVGKSLGLAEDGRGSMTGDQLEYVSLEELKSIAEKVRIYARVSPEHKMKIVDALKGLGHVVAMTGDGVNDAPALKRADIGVSMGITGTDVAKETSDMILTDDNFSSIVAAVEEGRIIYSNIAKFVTYLLSCNIGEILTIVTTMLMNLPLPLRPVQLLWLNLVTDSLPALALGVEKGDPHIMDRPPRDPAEPLLNRPRWVMIIVQSILIAGTTVAAFVYGLRTNALHSVADALAGDAIAYARTLAFSALVTSELLRAFTARSENEPLIKIGLLSNRAMLGANLISFLLLLAVIEIPGMSRIFGTVPMNVADWGVVFGLALIPSFGAEVLKLFVRP